MGLRLREYTSSHFFFGNKNINVRKYTSKETGITSRIGLDLTTLTDEDNKVPL